MKRMVFAGLCMAALLVPSGCGGAPREALRAAMGGGGELNFTLAENAGATKEILIENPVMAPHIPAGLGGHFIEEGGVKNETNFKIVAGGTCDIPGEVLQQGTSCTVRVRFEGARAKNAKYVVEYGNRLDQNLAKATFPVKSE